MKQIRSILFLCGFISIGLLIGVGFLTAFEFGSRLKYFYDTRFDDPVYAKTEVQGRGVSLEYHYASDPANSFRADSKAIVLHKDKDVVRFMPVEANILVGNFLEFSAQIQADDYVGQYAYVAIVADDKVKASTQVASSGRYKLLGYIPEKSRKIEIVIHANRDGSAVNLSNVTAMSVVKRPFLEFLNHKGFYEWTWNLKTLMERNLRTVFRAAKIPDAEHDGKKIFSLGGSTTYGLGAPPQGSISALTEKFLREEQIKASVFNFGIVGVSSTTTSRVMFEVLPQFSPWATIIHDGYNDLPVVLDANDDGTFNVIVWDESKNYYPVHKSAVISFFRYNFWSTWNRIYDHLTWFRQFLSAEGDVFMGSVRSARSSVKMSRKEVFAENKKRTKILIANTIEKIKFAKNKSQKIVIIIEPQIIPNWAPNGTGFRNANVGEIQKINHDEQQQSLLSALAEYSQDRDIAILDLRYTLTDKFEKFYVDESHLNLEGNAVIAASVTRALKEMH